MFLLDKVSQKKNKNFHISNVFFKQNIFDYRKLLQEKSELVEITSQLKSIYRDRDALFSVEYLKISEDLIWIIKYINNILPHKDLISADKLYIPDNQSVMDILSTCKIIEGRKY